MAHFQDSSDDEIGVNLQLAEKLSINRGVHAPLQGRHLNRKASKQLYNHRKKKHLDDQSSSSSSLEMHTNSSTLELSGYHNKKRQNKDKTAERFANPKRTCLSGRFAKSGDCRKKSTKKANSHSSKMGNLSSPEGPGLQRNLFPDKTYEDHMNNLSDDSDFAPRRQFPRSNVWHDTDADQTFINGSLSCSTRHSNYRNPPTIGRGAQFIESASDEDSRTVLQNGSLKGGRQSPTATTCKKILGRNVKKILDSEDTDNEDWSVVYRSRPLIFSSSDSEESTLEQANGKMAEGIAKNHANPSFLSGDSPKSGLDHSYHKPGETVSSYIYANSPVCPFSTQLQTLPPFRNIDPVNTPNEMRSFDRSNIVSNNIVGNVGTSFQTASVAGADEGHFRNLCEQHSRLPHGHKHGDIIPKSPRGRSVVSADSSLGRSGKSLLGHELDNGTTSNSGGTGRGAHLSVNGEEDRASRPVASFLENPRCHQRTKTMRHSYRSGMDKPNLAVIYPDLFDAEDSSDLEFFTANSYSDNESANNESVNRRLRAERRNQSIQFPDARCDTSINVASSEDEISVVYTSGPHARNSQQRRGGPRAMGRRYARGNHGQVQSSSAREVVSLSPDPVEQVRRMEEDERIARILQAQYDAEVDPTYVPCDHSPDPHQMNIRETTITDEEYDDSSMENEFMIDHLRTMMPIPLPFDIDIFRMATRAETRSRTGRPHRDQGGSIREMLFDLPTLRNQFRISDVTDGSYEAFLSLAELNGDVVRGLQKPEINRLPTRKYVAPGSASTSTEQPTHRRAELNKECQVCLSDYVNGDVLRILPCFHEFHIPCIDPWLKINHTCPVCRVRVEFGE